MCAEKLALYGGEKLKSTPFGAGNRFGENDLHHLKEALEQGTLFYWYGDKVKSLTKKFAEIYDMPYCVAASSGTAAVHVALGICGVTAGDEVITSPITDMGTIIGHFIPECRSGFCRSRSPQLHARPEVRGGKDYG